MRRVARECIDNIAGAVAACGYLELEKLKGTDLMLWMHDMPGQHDEDLVEIALLDSEGNPLQKAHGMPSAFPLARPQADFEWLRAVLNLRYWF